ncbi:hypothetical protein RhiirA4_478672 [Rhizophagus irregularis]|uniref:Uncharacterized protein n=1 Tax=Rhizophagus irregularis TaxID=588596 RepID=A0A2I1HF66_9GLOM|nr:hypothetical protein RhiirA4_478672 [Rhizophagus irregularis]
MGCRQSKTSQKKSQARFKILKTAHKSQLCQLEVDLSFRLADGHKYGGPIDQNLPEGDILFFGLSIYLLTENNFLQEEVATLTEFGIFQSGQIHQQEEEAQSNNELWAVTEEEYEEIVGLKNEVKQLKRENKSATYSTKYFETKYYHAMSVIHKYGMIVVDDNMPKSPSPVPSSSSSSFSSSSYDQIFVEDPVYIDDNNDNSTVKS